MNFSIEVLNVKTTTKPTAKGSYQEAEVAYKDLINGTVKSKKILSFVDKAIYSTFAGAKTGDNFEITAEKDTSGYWQWKEAKQGAPGMERQSNSGTSTASVRSTYETPDERAKKQVYIIRQSSLASAISTLSVGVKQPPAVGDVLQLAQQYVDFVLGNTSPAQSFDSMITELPE